MLQEFSITASKLLFICGRWPVNGYKCLGWFFFVFSLFTWDSAIPLLWIDFGKSFPRRGSGSAMSPLPQSCERASTQRSKQHLINSHIHPAVRVPSSMHAKRQPKINPNLGFGVIRKSVFFSHEIVSIISDLWLKSSGFKMLLFGKLYTTVFAQFCTS